MTPKEILTTELETLDGIDHKKAVLIAEFIINREASNLVALDVESIKHAVWDLSVKFEYHSQRCTRRGIPIGTTREMMIAEGICSKFAQPPAPVVPSVHEIGEVIFANPISGHSSNVYINHVQRLSEAIHALLVGGKK